MNTKIETTKKPRVNNGFAQTVRARRKNLRLTLMDLSNSTGMSRTTIFNIEHGINTSVSSMRTYVKALGGEIKITWPPLDMKPWLKRKKED